MMSAPGSHDAYLADLAGLPKLLWVYDGHCGFCSASVQFVLARDTRETIHFTAIGSPLGRRLARAHGVDPDDPSTFLFVVNGRALQSSDAVLALARQLPWPWRALLALGLLPKTWRDRGYDWVARNRFRLMGRRETCFVPSPAHRARFLD
jgi:predicted DCC family thiol-disulfide oxidoreductase YuxK